MCLWLQRLNRIIRILKQFAFTDFTIFDKKICNRNFLSFETNYPRKNFFEKSIPFFKSKRRYKRRKTNWQQFHFLILMLPFRFNERVNNNTSECKFKEQNSSNRTTKSPIPSLTLFLPIPASFLFIFVLFAFQFK